MRSGWLEILAALALMVAIRLGTIIAQPGPQRLAAYALGAASWATTWLILAAVRADLRERAGSLR